MGSEKAATSKTPHYAGHRDRLRQRFLSGGVEALQDYELLELILFMAIPRRDVKPLAKDLITTFGGLRGVLRASVQDLMDKDKGDLGENAAIAIKTVTAAAQHLLKLEVINRPVFSGWTSLLDYCRTTVEDETRENFRILFLNRKNELIADEIQGFGTVDHTPAYPREIMKRALEIGATALILVHNHPSGDPTPSKTDIQMTREIVDAARPFRILVHDHVIVSAGGHSSFKKLGLI